MDGHSYSSSDSRTQPYYHSNSSSSHDSKHHSGHAAPQPILPPVSNMFSGLHRRQPPGALRTPTLHHPVLTHSPGSVGTFDHSQTYVGSTESPSIHAGSLPDQLQESALLTGGMSPTQLTASALSAQKRAYRQRRKDPSCDACRERKVKCDATETSSCSECSSRSVKCQFTKETNRRMSSIKQVQDLQSQLADAKQQIGQLRSMLEQNGALSARRNDSERSPSGLPDLRQPAGKNRPLPSMNNFDHVRKNIRIYARGVFKPPLAYQQAAPCHPKYSQPASLPPLPPRHVADRLISQYLESTHSFIPVFHWPTFLQDYDDLYRRQGVSNTSSSRTCLFWAVLANGTLSTGRASTHECQSYGAGLDYAKRASQNTNEWNEDVNLEQATATFLIAVFLDELNFKSASWIHLGLAVRMAQELDIHTAAMPMHRMETEMKNRLWWAMCFSDRMLSLELGKPLLIDEDDCDAGWPTSFDDQQLQPHDLTRPRAGLKSRYDTASIIPVTRLVPALKRTLKEPVVSAATLQSYDDYFRCVASATPELYQIGSEAHLDLVSIKSALTLQIARFHLYRHNLSPACHPAERVYAVNRLLDVAQETAKYIMHGLQTPPGTTGNESGPGTQAYPSFEKRVQAIASNMLARHCWRCILVLCFRAEYATALTCLQVNAAIGDMRKLNVACGRNLAFFLDRLLERIRNGYATPQHLEQDEEMLAYISGDMQGTEFAWVWAGSELASTPSMAMHNLNSMASTPLSASANENGDSITSNTSLSDQEAQDWGGWERLERTIRQLMDEQRARYPPQVPYYHAPAHNPGKRVQLTQPHLTLPPPPPPPQSAHGQTLSPTSGGTSPDGPSSRISIQNII